MRRLRSLRGGSVAWVLGLAALGVAPSALAQAPPSAAVVREARMRFDNGVQLSREGHFEIAIAEFQRAYDLTHNPAVLFNIGVTREALGQFVEALDAMDAYLRDAQPEVLRRNAGDASAALARLRNRVGTLVVELSHPGLEVRRNGVVLPLERARQGLRTVSGHMRLSLSAPGFATEDRELELAAGDTVRVTAPLRALRLPLAVQCNVEGAEVLVDGEALGRTPLGAPLQVGLGSHTVELRREGYAPFRAVVQGEASRVEAQLEWLDPMPAAVGARLRVRVEASGARVSVDGRRVERGATVLAPPGAHRLRVEADGYLPREQRVELASGALREVEVRLEPTEESLAAQSRALAERRRAGAILLGVGGAAVVLGAAATGVGVSIATLNGSRYGAVNGLVQEASGALRTYGLTHDTEVLDQFRSGGPASLVPGACGDEASDPALASYLLPGHSELPTQQVEGHPVPNIPGVRLVSTTVNNFVSYYSNVKAALCVRDADQARQSVGVGLVVPGMILGGLGLGSMVAGAVLYGTSSPPARGPRRALAPSVMVLPTGQGFSLLGTF